jgi:hypothetical protein
MLEQLRKGADIFTKTAVHYDQDGEAEDHALALIATGGAMPEVLYNVVCLLGLGWRFVLCWLLNEALCVLCFVFPSSCRPS